MNKDRMLSTMLELCAIPSISESEGERAIVSKLHEILGRIDYFKKNPNNIKVHPIEGDPLGRSFITAFMEGSKKKPRTLILLSHFDVVAVEDFGVFRDYAFKPVEYTEFLKTNENITLPSDAKKDLDSGDYLFGRGTMDMKYGISANIEVLYQSSEHPEDFEGNLLFLSVPDEEANSAGMLAAVDTLLSIRAEKNLEYVCCLVTEPHFPKYPGDTVKYIYTGTVGKLLPGFYCVGKETHVGEPFAGLNPNLLTAKIIEHIEQNPELSDSVGEIRVPAPMCLKHSDTKEEYSVQIPTAAYSYFNFMTLTSTPEEIMNKMKTVAQRAFTEVLEDIKKRAAVLEKLTGSRPELPEIEPKVLSFMELYAMCIEAHGEIFERHMREFSESSTVTDLRQLSVEFVKEVHKFSPYRGPMVVVFYAPPYYPHSTAADNDSKIMKVAAEITETAKEKYGESLSIEPFFMGLSDMSYLGLCGDINIEGLQRNFPLWGSKYSVPLQNIAALNVPFMNIGPLGKDAHKYTERLCVSYSFNEAAHLIYSVAQQFCTYI